MKSEQDALRLVLKKYINVVSLLEELDRYDPTLTDYYSSAPVVFAGACSVDLRTSDLDGVYKSLAARIYKIRNSLVHSKEGDKANYRPFVDDKDLRRDIPLLRFVAEQILVGSSTIL